MFKESEQKPGLNWDKGKQKPMVVRLAVIIGGKKKKRKSQTSQ